MLKIVGQSSLISKQDVTALERAIIAAVGHADIDTTAGYAVTQSERLARIFTNTSRWPRVSAPAEGSAEFRADAGIEHIDSLQRLLAETLEKLASVGVTSPAMTAVHGSTFHAQPAVGNGANPRLSAVATEKCL